MLTTRIHRLDPSLIPEEQLVEVAKAFAKSDDVVLIDSQGKQTHIPEALFAHFARIVRIMSERRAIVMLPEDEAFTTQAAANYLGMSRQFFVNLLEYERNRDRTRREAMDQLTDEVIQAGKYFPVTDPA